MTALIPLGIGAGIAAGAMEASNWYEGLVRDFARETVVPERRKELDKALAKHGDVRPSSVLAMGLGVATAAMGAVALSRGGAASKGLFSTAVVAGAGAVASTGLAYYHRSKDRVALGQATHTASVYDTRDGFSYDQAARRLDFDEFHDMKHWNERGDYLRSLAGKSASAPIDYDLLISAAKAADANNSGTLNGREWHVLSRGHEPDFHPFNAYHARD